MSDKNKLTLLLNLFIKVRINSFNYIGDIEESIKKIIFYKISASLNDLKDNNVDKFIPTLIFFNNIIQKIDG